MFLLGACEFELRARATVKIVLVIAKPYFRAISAASHRRLLEVQVDALDRVAAFVGDLEEAVGVESDAERVAVAQEHELGGRLRPRVVPTVQQVVMHDVRVRHLEHTRRHGVRTTSDGW